MLIIRNFKKMKMVVSSVCLVIRSFILKLAFLKINSVDRVCFWWTIKSHISNTYWIRDAKHLLFLRFVKIEESEGDVKSDKKLCGQNFASKMAIFTYIFNRFMIICLSLLMSLYLGCVFYFLFTLHGL